MPDPDDGKTFGETSETATQSTPQRLDKWLWYARVVKTRSLAAALVTRGRVRVNRERTQKPSQLVKPGDVITASVSREVRVLKVLLPGTRRGPASEAQTLYEDLAPVSTSRQSPGGAPGEVSDKPNSGRANAVLDTGSGRPSKKERRQIVRLKGQDR